MSEIDPTMRPDLPLEDLPEENLFAPEGVNEGEDQPKSADVRSGGDASAAPARDDDQSAKEDELVGAGPTTQDEVEHGDSGMDDGYIDG
ncbi:hypothetical protein [Georgenia faecalis]|uniref:hypothetical protein n=1 Tax=Georgenia faecalis TaxID=2483799 RepID=UPI000FD7D392|nr:hypothetical protein [Georgenia faecalis]